MMQILLTWGGISIVSFIFGYILYYCDMQSTIETRWWDHHDFMTVSLRSSIWSIFFTLIGLVFTMAW